MRAFVPWLVVTAAFVALNVLGGLALYGVFLLNKVFAPSLMEEPFFVYPLGLATVAGTIGIAYKVHKWINRPRSLPDRRV